MKDQDKNYRAVETPGDARDILARLYREIGISAVAAALQVSEAKPNAAKTEDAARWAHRRFNDYAA
jgi:hypothetical protein